MEFKIIWQIRVTAEKSNAVNTAENMLMQMYVSSLYSNTSSHCKSI